MDLDELRRRISFAGTFEGLIGTVYDAYAPGELAGHVDVRADMLTRHGTAPLGVYATVAEGAASVGSAMEILDQGLTASGMSNDTTVTGSVPGGRVDFRAVRQHDGQDLAVWNIEFTANAAVVAVSIVRIAIRPRRSN